MTILENVYSKVNFMKSWRSVKEKGKAGGIDNVTIAEFEKDLNINLENLQAEVLGHKYCPEPYKRIFIEKNSDSPVAHSSRSELRPLALIAVKDKLVQLCFLNFFRYKIEKTFTDTSYAYRIGKGHNKAVNRINDFIQRHNKWICTIDIDNYFDSIDRQILLQKCSTIFKDAALMRLLEMWIKIGIIYKGKYIGTNMGIAQGGVISPFLSNIYLDSFDKEMHGHKFNNVRYADNIILIEKEKEKLQQSLSFTKTYLKEYLHLNLNPIDKEAVNVSTECFTFCGIQFTEGKRKIDPHKFQKIINNISNIIQKNNLNNITEILNENVEGIKRYYAAFDTNDQIQAIEEYLINQLIPKISLELSKKTISSLADAKKILKDISFPISKSFSSKEILIRKIIGSCLEKQHQKTDDTRGEVNKAISQKRKQYQKYWYESLDVLISGANSFIGKSGYKITIRKEGKIRNEVSADRIKNILIAANGVTISSDAVKLCAEKNIRVNYFDGLGRPYASIIPAMAPINVLVNKQAEVLQSVKAAVIAKNIIYAKVKNQQSLIKYFSKNKKSNVEEVSSVKKELDNLSLILESIRDLDVKISLPQFRAILMGYEGNAAVSYWKLFGEFIPAKYQFEKREHQHAENIVNMMLNYAYGILYTRVLGAVTLLGLNPNISFLHSEQRDKPALVFDLIEIFRAPVADRTVIAILNKGVKVKTEKNFLSDSTKTFLAKKVLQRLNAEFIRKGKIANFNEIIIEQVKALISYINDESKSYKPFLSKW